MKTLGEMLDGQLNCPMRNTTITSHRRDGSVIISQDIRKETHDALLAHYSTMGDAQATEEKQRLSTQPNRPALGTSANVDESQGVNPMSPAHRELMGGEG